MGQEPNHIAIARLGLVLIHMELRNLMDPRRRSIVFYSHFFRNFTLGNPTYTLQEPSWQDKRGFSSAFVRDLHADHLVGRTLQLS